MGEPTTYRPCGNVFDGPGAPEGVVCERPRGHSWHHRKSIGGASMTWPNTARVDDRAVRVNLPLFARNGSVHVGGHEVSNVVSGVKIDADVNSATLVTLTLKPGSLDLDAEGHGKITPGAHQLLELLGWMPPETRAAVLAECAGVGSDDRDALAERVRSILGEPS